MMVEHHTHETTTLAEIRAVGMLRPATRKSSIELEGKRFDTKNAKPINIKANSINKNIPIPIV